MCSSSTITVTPVSGSHGSHRAISPGSGLGAIAAALPGCNMQPSSAASTTRADMRRVLIGYGLWLGFVFFGRCHELAAEDRRPPAFGGVFFAAQHRGVLALSLVRAPAADRGGGSFGRVLTASADRGVFSGGDIFYAPADRGCRSAGGVRAA